MAESDELKRPPPIPERPGRPTTQQNYAGSYHSAVGAGYPMGMGYGGAAGYGNSYYSPTSYGGYRPMGMGYGGNYMGSYGSSAAPTPHFIQMAEENTRPAFETIQSVVYSFNSISMMFESTYYALHSSFRAWSNTSRGPRFSCHKCFQP